MVEMAIIISLDWRTSRERQVDYGGKRIRLILKRILTVPTRKTFSGERSPASWTPPHETLAAVCPVFYDLVPALDQTLVATMLRSWLTCEPLYGNTGNSGASSSCQVTLTLYPISYVAWVGIEM